MFKTKKIISNSVLSSRFILATALTVAVVGSSVAVYADRYDDQINALRQQNSATQAAVNNLSAEASSYQDAISRLQGQINSLQALLSANRAKQASLQTQIDAAKAKIAVHKEYLAEAIKTMYIDGQLSSIEQLAASDTLSDYVDKEEYRTSVQNKVDSIIKDIAVLQAQLQDQKVELDKLIEGQQAQNQTLATLQSQQQEMLAYNEGQRAAYSNQIAGNNSRIDQLKKAQAAENCRIYGCGGGTRAKGSGGYPWTNARCIHDGSLTGYCYNYDWAIGGNIYNPETSYGYRNCTDYVAWRTGAPGGLGNANQWDDRIGGWKSSPSAGDAAVDNSGGYGHVMYVEWVSGNQMGISDYNRAGTGAYDTATLTKVGNGVYKTETGGTRVLTFKTF